MKTTSIRQYALATLIAATSTLAQGQEFNSGYFVDGMTTRHDFNPAFDGEYNYISIPVLGSLNVKMQGNFGLKDVLFKNPETGHYNRTFMHPDVSVSEALSGFHKGANKTMADIGVTILSSGFHAFGGYNTIEVKEKANLGISVPYELFEFAKDLYNRTYEFDEIRAKAFAYTEVALGHSHQITDKLCIGAKIKFLLGEGNADLTIKNMRANLVGDTWALSTGKAEANINMKNITFKNKVSEYKYTNGTYEHLDFGETDVDGFGFGGFGLGLDLGAEYQIMEGLKVSAAVTDLGFISWSNNYLLKQRNNQFTFDGFHDVTIKNETSKHGDILDDQVDSYADQLSDFLSLSNEGDTGSKTTALAATINVGGEYILPMYEPLTVGLLFQQRLNGSFSWTEGRLSANWSPLSWLNGGINVAINNIATSAGWVINIHPKGYNFFIGMDHILGKMSKEFVPLSSNASITLGMAITWGGKKTKKLMYTPKESISTQHGYESQDW